MVAYKLSWRDWGCITLKNWQNTTRHFNRKLLKPDRTTLKKIIHCCAQICCQKTKSKKKQKIEETRKRAKEARDGVDETVGEGWPQWQKPRALSGNGGQLQQCSCRCHAVASPVAVSILPNLDLCQRTELLWKTLFDRGCLCNPNAPPRVVFWSPLIFERSRQQLGLLDYSHPLYHK